MLATKKWKLPRAFEAEFNAAKDFDSSRKLYLAYRSKLKRLTSMFHVSRQIGLIGLIIALASGITAVVLSSSDSFNLVVVAVLGVVSFVASIFPTALTMGLIVKGEQTGTRLQLARQNYFDLLARKTMAKLNQGETPEDYTLYLRPFNTTDAMYYLGALSGPDLKLDGSGLFRSLEESVAAAVETKAPLIGLGIPREHLGAGRIQVTDQEWQEAVRILARGASLIVLVPSVQPGTHWEVEHVLGENLLARCVVINLPDASVRLRGGNRRRRNYRSDEWRRLQELFAARGLTLPDAQKRGRLLFFGHELKPNLTIEFGRLRPSVLSTFFDRVFSVSRA